MNMNYLCVSGLAGIHRTTELAENGFEMKSYMNSTFPSLRKLFFRKKKFSHQEPEFLRATALNNANFYFTITSINLSQIRRKTF